MKKSSGFTLIELLVVMLLTALLMTTIGGILGQVSGGINRAGDVRSEALQIHNVFEQLTADLYRYRIGYTAITENDLRFEMYQDQPNSATPMGSAFSVGYAITTANDITTLSRTVRPLRLDVPAITTVLWEITNSEDTPKAFFGHINRTSIMPLWNDENNPPLGTRLTLIDSRGHTWTRDIAILSGRDTRL